MKVNVDKVLERDAKLSELDSRAGKYILEGFVFFICSCERCICITVTSDSTA